MTTTNNTTAATQTANKPAPATKKPCTLSEAMKSITTATGITSRNEVLHLLGLQIANLANVRTPVYTVATSKGGIGIAKESKAELAHLIPELMTAVKGMAYRKGVTSREGLKADGVKIFDLETGLNNLGVGRTAKSATAKTAKVI